MLRFFRRPDTPTLTQERDALAKFADKYARDVDLLRAECAELNSAKMDLARQLAEVCRERDDAMSFAHVSGEILIIRNPAVPYWDEKTQKWKRPSTDTAYCWLVWQKSDGLLPTSTQFEWIAPCRKRLERVEDYQEAENG